MSKVLRSFDWTITSKFNAKPRKRFYPWDDLFDGRIHELIPGEDFDGPAYSVERVVRTTANRRKVRVRVRVQPSETAQALIAKIKGKISKARGKTVALDLDTLNALLDLAAGGGDNTLVLQQHDDADNARRTTKSPPSKSAVKRSAAKRTAAKAEAPSANGDTPTTPSKRVAAKRPTARKQTAAKRPSKRQSVSA